MGLLSLNYRRPAYVERGSNSPSETSLDLNEKSDASLRSGRSGQSAGIPPQLSFDRIIDEGTCPPCTVRDFMNYLIYVERSAENLQFFLWYRDYVKRFASANTADLSLAPEWTKAMEDEAMVRIRKENTEKARTGLNALTLKGLDPEKTAEPAAGHPEGGNGANPFITPPRTPADRDHDSVYSGSNAQTYRTQASDAFAAAGARLPFTIQPFREEMDRVVATYIMEGAPRQLNLSAREQKAVLQALSYTTHPSALRTIASSIESSLRHQAHPNFIRWSICNGNPARVTFARALGVSLLVLGTAAAIVLTLSRAGRGWRALAAIAWVLGAATLIAAYKGMCVVLHGLHHRHVRPWELFVTDEEDAIQTKRSFDSFASSNSYEDEPWVVRYRKRNIIRKIFDREVFIKEPALRQIQDTIFVQSILCALLGAGILAAIFVAVPGGNFF